jgi:hypothetical protein
MLGCMKMRLSVALALTMGGVCIVPVCSLAQERQWSLDSTDREAFLVFGVPDTDDVGLSFWCAIGSGKVSAYLPLKAPILKAGQHTDMKLSVDGKPFHLPATAAPEGNEGRMTLEGTFHLKDKLMGVLKGADSIAVTVKNHTDTYPLADADFASLVNACNGIDSGT